MPNAHKEMVVSELRDIVSQSKGAILTDYRGLTVAEVTNLRKKLREVDAEYHIVKNTLFKIAVGSDGATLDPLLTGPTAIAFARADVVAPAKAVLDFLRDLKKPEIKVKGGWIDGKIYTVDQVTALSKLPPREQVVAQLVGTLNGPASELVGTLDNIIAEIVRTIQAIADKAGEGGAPVGAGNAAGEEDNAVAAEGGASAGESSASAGEESAPASEDNATAAAAGTPENEGGAPAEAGATTDGEAAAAE